MRTCRPVDMLPSLLVVLVSLVGAASAQTVLTVGQGGTHGMIQAAIDACPSEGCTIQLLDSAYLLPRELWIEGRRNLAIEAAPALRQAGIRPRLHADAKTLMMEAGTASKPADPLRPAGWKRWPTSCKDSLGGSLDTANPYSTSGYQYNGLVVIVASRDIRIEGLALDGVEPVYFGNKGIWECKFGILFGSVGVNLFQSRSVVLRDNEIRNFFSGLYIQNRNPGGAASAWNNVDAKGPEVPRYSAYGTMGDHMVERNDIHHNWWAVYDEMEWDLGSTFRFNRVASNVNAKYGTYTDFVSEMQDMPGGFLFVKDVSQVVHRIHNNTIWGSPVVIGHNGYKYGVQHLFYNNIVGGFEQILRNRDLKGILRDYRQLLSYYGDWLDNNLFELRDSTASLGTQFISNGQVTDSSLCSSHGQSAPCYLKYDSAVTCRFVIAWPWMSWKVATNGKVRGKVDGATVEMVHPPATEQFPGGGVVKSFMPETKLIDVEAAANHWAFAVPWKSTIPGTTGFLEPDWNDSLVMRTALTKGRPASGWHSPDRGAVPSNHAYPTIWALRSQLPVVKSGANCFSVPLRTASGSVTGPVRIAKVEAWSMVPMSPQAVSLGTTKRLSVRALADSSFVDGASRTVCLDSTPSSAANLRLQLELEATTPSGLLRSEPTYFLLDSPTADFSVGIPRSPLPQRPLRAHWSHDALVLSGLANGTARITVRALDGRLVLETDVGVANGMAMLPLRNLPTGATIVTVEQEGWSRAILTARMMGR